MPLYTFRCNNGHERDVRLPVTARDSFLTCDECILAMRRVRSTPHIAPVKGIPNKLDLGTFSSNYEPGPE